LHSDRGTEFLARRDAVTAIWRSGHFTTRGMPLTRVGILGRELISDVARSRTFANTLFTEVMKLMEEAAR
jgi:hypothetical protein